MAAAGRRFGRRRRHLGHRHHAVGSGTIQANGGNNCLPASRLLPDSNECTASSSGAGGGGRIAVTAPHPKARTGQVTAAGGVNFDYPGRAGIKGKNGTVWLSKAA